MCPVRSVRNYTLTKKIRRFFSGTFLESCCTLWLSSLPNFREGQLAERIICAQGKPEEGGFPGLPLENLPPSRTLA